MLNFGLRRYLFTICKLLSRDYSLRRLDVSICRECVCHLKKNMKLGVKFDVKYGVKSGVKSGLIRV